MLTLPLTAPGRALLSWLLHRLNRRAARTVQPGALPHLTDRAARDIGLRPGETALLRHRWPSERGPRHPML